ncbi:MAG: TIGR00730 family Rossman fold protein [Bryobacterales bacterium]|nr:TIGR00730 family Rossman fold protein [Bryobacterales bacterium]
MSHRLSRVCVFCGSSNGFRPRFREAAAEFGALLAAERIGLVYGGGGTGLMGAVADAVLQQGGEVIGVIPEALVAREVAHRALQDLRVVPSMHERKALMADLSDGFVALPGAFGTLDEFCEIITWAQLGIHNKPCGLWNVDQFWDPLLAMFAHSEHEGFLKPAHRQMVLAEDDPRRLLQRLKNHTATVEDKWRDLR